MEHEDNIDLYNADGHWRFPIPSTCKTSTVTSAKTFTLFKVTVLRSRPLVATTKEGPWSSAMAKPTDMQDKYCEQCYDMRSIQSHDTKMAALGRHPGRISAGLNAFFHCLALEHEEANVEKAGDDKLVEDGDSSDSSDSSDSD